MPTIGWHDVACTQASGPIQFHNLTINIGPEHLERWLNDPDGRFKLRPSAIDPRQADLDKFYPSL